jgi:hypothetical protein
MTRASLKYGGWERAKIFEGLLSWTCTCTGRSPVSLTFQLPLSSPTQAAWSASTSHPKAASFFLSALALICNFPPGHRAQRPNVFSVLPLCSAGPLAYSKWSHALFSSLCEPPSLSQSLTRAHHIVLAIFSRSRPLDLRLPPGLPSFHPEP